MAEELALDLEELRHLQSIAKRPRILSLISSEIRNLEKLQTSREDGNAVSPPTASQIPTRISTSVKAPIKPALAYVSVSSFSWDQDNDKVKIYVSLEGVEQEKIQTEFKSMSFDVKFHDVKGKNYRCAVPKLNKEIVLEKCKVVVKPTRVIITLFKASKGDWSDLYFKGDKLKPNLDKEQDPMAGIMDLMKNMYEEGDEEMKRTIAKAWTDARSGKAEDTLKGY
ncbi:Detected protein of confused Function [Hibiscus syriacus]|uniref:Calcyclin-binding protein n=1 Tax=Hibiscus syriacus TaxID=106335 RepID=A0A6A2XTL3_HIBSY|nr:calcyclin-binding protein-like [Hibiscus syriacus]KAE8659627.1 Detected protein of confused Function [Hibiscus syriacus]